MRPNDGRFRALSFEVDRPRRPRAAHQGHLQRHRAATDGPDEQAVRKQNCKCNLEKGILPLHQRGLGGGHKSKINTEITEISRRATEIEPSLRRRWGSETSVVLREISVISVLNQSVVVPTAAITRHRHLPSPPERPPSTTTRSGGSAPRDRRRDPLYRRRRRKFPALVTKGSFHTA